VGERELCSISVPYSEGKNRVTFGVSAAHFILFAELDNDTIEQAEPRW
jgi:hypothetical protein